MLSNRYPIPNLKLIENTRDLSSEIKTEEDFSTYFFQSTLEIQKSLFICTIAHCDTVEGARKAIEFLQNKYQDATHNCYAFQVKEPKSTAYIGYSDDNEPHGTAGKPMLTALLYADIGEVVAVVTRYFGGVKLGTGGLVRAYQGAVSEALLALEKVEKVEKIEIKITLEYNNTSYLHRILEDYDGIILKEEYSTNALFTILLPEDKKEDFVKKLQDLTSSNCLV